MINSLYIHIPFCVKKCIYCDFFSVPYNEELALRYTNALVRELGLRREEAGELRTVYIGGGTPTTIPFVALVRLLRAIRENFRLSPDAEITIEANPGTIDKEKGRILFDCGVNRFSLGVQSFHNDHLKLLGRIHDFSDTLKAVAAVRAAGVRNLSIDLIYGIPGQTLDDWAHTVSTATELSPEHISAYELTPEEGTPLYGLIQEGELAKPDEETIIEMYYHAIDSFAEAGYEHYEISNFARPGFACRHNLNYWNRGQYIGAGAGAHGFIIDKRIKNIADIQKYIETVKRGELPVEESAEVSCGDAMKEFIFLGLRKMEGLNIRQFREDLGIDLFAASDELIAQGLLVSDGNYLRLSRKGIVVSNTVIAHLFEKLEIR